MSNTLMRRWRCDISLAHCTSSFPSLPGEQMKQKTSIPRTDLLDVLLVDDERQVLNLAKELLEMHGPFKVETAMSVDEAFCKLGAKEFSAIISDYAMPAKDGLEFLRE